MPDVVGLDGAAYIEKEAATAMAAIAETERLKRQILAGDSSNDAKIRQIAA